MNRLTTLFQFSLAAILTMAVFACSDDSTGGHVDSGPDALVDGAGDGGSTETCNGLDDDGDGVTDDPACLVPVYRFLADATGDHMYKAGDQSPDPGYRQEPFATFRLYVDQADGTVPLYQVTNGTDHMVTTNPDEGITSGYEDAELLGYAALPPAWQAASWSPTTLCRYRNQDNGDHMLFVDTPHLESHDYIKEDCAIQVWDWTYDRAMPPVCRPSYSVDCTQADQYLPLVTHWSQGAYSYLGTDPVDLFTAQPIPDPDAYQPGDCYFSYKLGLPDYEDYFCDTYSFLAVPDDQARQTMQQICQWIGVPVRLLPPAPWDPTLPEIEEPTSGSCQVQIIHATLVDGSLATIFLPPNWVSDAPEGTYPIFLNSFYDLNDNLFNVHGPTLMAMVGQSGLNGRRGIIGVLSNGGGALASRGFDEHMYEVSAELIDWVSTHFGGSRYEVVTFGGSRGAFTSLAIASNPYGYDYRVLLAAAVAPPTILGSHMFLTTPTFPGLYAVMHQDVGLADAWKTGWHYPACAGKQNLEGLTGPEALLQILTGTPDIDEANENRSLTSSGHIQGLLSADTQVYVEVTGHDVICPYVLQVAYGAALLQAGIPAEIHVALRNGHASIGDRFVQVLQNAQDLLTTSDASALGPTDPTPDMIAPGVHFWVVDRTSGDHQEIHPDTYPFTFEGPYKVAPGQSYPFVFVGEEGTEYELSIFDPSNHEVQTITGTITDGLSIVWKTEPPGPAGGPYSYHLRIRKPTGVWQDIPDTNTPSGDPATLWVLDSEPNVSGLDAASLFSPPAASYAQDNPTSWGLSEY